VLNGLAAKRPNAGNVRDCYIGFRDKIVPWSRASMQAMLEARAG
jgi:hypothetical protein